MARSLETSIDIEAPPQDVWAVLLDLPAYGDWNPFIVAAEGTAEPGERLTLRMQVAGKSFTLRPTVHTRTEAQVLRWRGSVGVRGLFDGEHVHELQPIPTGTRYVQRERFTGVLLPLMARTVDATERAFGQMNLALKQRAEARTAPPASPPPADQPPTPV